MLSACVVRMSLTLLVLAKLPMATPEPQCSGNGSAVPKEVEALRKSRLECERLQAVKLLKAAPAREDWPVAVLLSLTRDQSTVVKGAAFHSLGHRRAGSPEVIQRCKQALLDPNEPDFARGAAGTALRLIDIPATRQLFVELLDYTDYKVRLVACNAIAWDGTIADGAIDRLLARLEEEDGSIRSSIEETLERISTTVPGAAQQMRAKLAPALAELQRSYLLLALTKCDSSFKIETQQVRELLRSKSDDVRNQALKLVEVLQNRGTNVDDLILMAMRDKNPRQRSFAIFLIDTTKMVPHAIRNQLASAMDDSNEDVIYMAVCTSAKVRGIDRDELINRLIQVLERARGPELVERIIDQLSKYDASVLREYKPRLKQITRAKEPGKERGILDYAYEALKQFVDRIPD